MPLEDLRELRFPLLVHLDRPSLAQESGHFLLLWDMDGEQRVLATDGTFLGWISSHTFRSQYSGVCIETAGSRALPPARRSLVTGILIGTSAAALVGLLLRRRGSRASRLAAAFLFGLGGCGAAPEEGGALLAGPEFIDVGVFGAADSRIRTGHARFRNVTSRTRVLREIVESCACSEATLSPSRIPPGASARLDFKLTLKEGVPTNATLRLWFENEEQPQVVALQGLKRAAYRVRWRAPQRLVVRPWHADSTERNPAIRAIFALTVHGGESELPSSGLESLHIAGASWTGLHYTAHVQSFERTPGEARLQLKLEPNARDHPRADGGKVVLAARWAGEKLVHRGSFSIEVDPGISTSVAAVGAPKNGQGFDWRAVFRGQPGVDLSDFDVVKLPSGVSKRERTQSGSTVSLLLGPCDREADAPAVGMAFFGSKRFPWLRVSLPVVLD